MKIERGYSEYNERLITSKKVEQKYTQTTPLSIKKDNLDLSDTSKKIRENHKCDSLDSIRESKIAALKQSIKDGSYQVSTEEIAKSMINSMKTTKDL